MDGCQRREADASASACDRGMRFGAVSKVLYSKPGAAYWQAIVHMSRSLALGSDPGHSARFCTASLEKLKAVPFSDFLLARVTANFLD